MFLLWFGNKQTERGAKIKESQPLTGNERKRWVLYKLEFVGLVSLCGLASLVVDSKTLTATWTCSKALIFEHSHSLQPKEGVPSRGRFSDLSETALPINNQFEITRKKEEAMVIGWRRGYNNALHGLSFCLSMECVCAQVIGSDLCK